MDLHGWQTSQGVHDILFRVLTNLLNRGSLHHLCQHRPGSDRRGTSEGFETRRRDVTILNLQVQMQNIPAGGVLRYADSIRALQGTDISRILIVIQDDIVVQTQGIFSEMDDRLAPCRGSAGGSSLVGDTNILLPLPGVNRTKNPLKSIINKLLAQAI